MADQDCIENVQCTQTRVKMLQAAWPTGDAVRPGAIDWNSRNRAGIQEIAQSQLFLAATICMTIIAVPFTLAFGVLSPFVWMAVGLWVIHTQARKNSGHISRVGFVFLVVGQYINFAVGVLSALFSFCVLVEGCTDLGKQYTDLVDVLFWGSGLLMIATFLIAGLRWKIVCAVKAIRDANDGYASDGSILVGAIAVCFVVGIGYCLTVVGIIYGIMAILFGCVLLRYYKNVNRIEEEMQAQELLKGEQCEIVPTWKLIEEGR